MTPDTKAIHVNIRLDQERSAIIRRITPPGVAFGTQARLLLEKAIDAQVHCYGCDKDCKGINAGSNRPCACQCH